MFIVILEEVKHVALDVVDTLPSSCDACGGIAAHHRTDGVVQTHFVVEVIKVSTIDVISVFVWIIHLCDEENLGVLLPFLVEGKVATEATLTFMLIPRKADQPNDRPTA